MRNEWGNLRKVHLGYVFVSVLFVLLEKCLTQMRRFWLWLLCSFSPFLRLYQVLGGVWWGTWTWYRERNREFCTHGSNFHEVPMWWKRVFFFHYRQCQHVECSWSTIIDSLSYVSKYTCVKRNIVMCLITTHRNACRDTWVRDFA